MLQRVPAESDGRGPVPFSCNASNFGKSSEGVDLVDSTFLTGLDFFAIGDVVSVFFDLVGLLMPKFFVPLGVLTSG